jgi:hypothetical protein
VLSLVNAAIMKYRAARYIRANPELEAGYRAIIKGMLVWGDIPFVVMGIGCVFGKIPSVFYFFRPHDGNPYVVAFYVVVVLEYILGTNWIVFRGGAAMLVKHPGVLNIEATSPRMVIFLWVVSCVGGIVGFILFYYQIIPMPLG